MEKCIKCGKEYKGEPDYYCSDCETLKMKVAREIDKKFVRSGPIPSLLNKYDEAKKASGHGFPRASEFL